MNRKIGVFEKTTTYFILLFIGFLLVSPFVYMISISLASDATTTKSTFTFLPREFVFSNFVKVFTHKNLGLYIMNSIKIVTFVTIGTVFSSSFVAFGFARLRSRTNKLFFLILLCTMMIPGEVTMIPQFIIFRNLGWINTLLPLIVPAFFGSAFNIFLIRQFIMRIPKSLDEAAKIDGLGYFGIYYKIIIPQIKPALIAVAIFSFAWGWGNFMGPLIYINDAKKIPLALGVQLISSKVNAGSMPPWNLVMVASMFLTIPMVLVYMFGQKYMYQIDISAGSAGIK